MYSPQDVYARKLLSHRGYPLWTPEPGVELPGCYRREGFKIGDVGVVSEDGSFDVFFNITLPKDHPLHAAYGVPGNFTPVQLIPEDYKAVPNAECPGRALMSSSTNCRINHIDPVLIDGRAHRSTDYQFTQDQEAEGAMLILPQGAERRRLLKTLSLLDIVIGNAIGWYRFARESLGRDIRNDDLYLITGFHKAESWSLASFRDVPVPSIRCKIVQQGQVGAISPNNCLWECTHSLEWRIGPRESDGRGIPNQTVFIVGFKIAVKEELLHWKRVTVKVDPSKRTLASTLVGFGASLGNLLSGAGDSEHSFEPTIEGADGVMDNRPEHHVSVSNVPQVFQPFHPSNTINHYLLKQDPSAKIAVTHDSQWISLLERRKLKQQDMTQGDRLEEAISREYSIATKDGALYTEDTIAVPSVPIVEGMSDQDSGGHNSSLQNIAWNATAGWDNNPYSGSSSGAWNDKFDDEDAIELVAAAFALKQYYCRWLTRGELCNALVRGQDFPAHLSLVHNISNTSRFTCLWDDCGERQPSKNGLVRHMQERHLEYRWPCPSCSATFTRKGVMKHHLVICRSRK